MDRAARCITGARGQVGVNIEEKSPVRKTGEAATGIYPASTASGKAANPPRRSPSPAAHGPRGLKSSGPREQGPLQITRRRKGQVRANLICQ
jgi:hypothetical protein